MDIRNQFPSKYIRSAQVAGCPGGTIRVQIDRLAIEKMRARGGAQEEKPVLYFQRAKKGMVLNRTNADVIGGAFGWETNDWRGHTIELYVAEVEAFGEVMDAIRVRVPKSQPPGKETAQKAAPAKPAVPPEAPAEPEDVFPEPEEGEVDGEGNPF